MNEKIYLEIMNINKVICDNIDKGEVLDRGLLSQNILSQIRNLIEDVIVLVYNNKHGKDLDENFINKRTAYTDLYSKPNPRFLMEFHRCLQASKSHYTSDYDGAERLMQKYYYYLLKLRNYLQEKFNLCILENIEKFPINLDNTLNEYYKKIATKIDEVIIDNKKKLDKARYYVQKIKPFSIENKIYYEVTLSSATDNVNKFDRMIVFTQCEIMPNYSLIFSFVEKEIELFESKLTIKIVDNWMVSIRSCEINNMAKILNLNNIVKSNFLEYKNMMQYLTDNNITLLDMALMTNEIYLCKLTFTLRNMFPIPKIKRRNIKTLIMCSDNSFAISLKNGDCFILENR
ncbi:MAG: hypothetical protein PHQ89_04505 [Bacilli bacterium]|nr:hypothetical protein [Bacilli bacterium]